MIKKLIAFHAFLLLLFIPGIAQNVGIGNTNPQFLLDISGRMRIRSQDAVFTSGIYFNKIDNSNTQAFVGMHSDSYVGFFGVPLNSWGLLMNTSNGNVGINNTSPQALLHIVKGQGTNGPLLSSSAAIIEGDQGGWLQLSNNNNIEGGILSGNQQTAIRGAVVFGTDSSLMLRSGGNFTRLTLTKTGAVNISGELNRPSTGSANLVPICYGSVNLDGVVLSGTGNFSVVRFQGGEYIITITGENYNDSDYCVFITPMSGFRNVYVEEYPAFPDKLFLAFNNLDEVSIQTAFHFIVYKP